MQQLQYDPRSRIHALVVSADHQRVSTVTAAPRRPPARTGGSGSGGGSGGGSGAHAPSSKPHTNKNKKAPGVVLHVVNYPGLCDEVGVPPSTPVLEVLDALARTSTMTARAGAASVKNAATAAKQFGEGNFLVYALIGLRDDVPQYLAVGLTTGSSALPQLQGTWTVLSAFGGSANPFSRRAIECAAAWVVNTTCAYEAVFGWSRTPYPTPVSRVLGSTVSFVKVVRGLWDSYRRDVVARRALGLFPDVAKPPCRQALLLELLFNAAPTSAAAWARVAGPPAPVAAAPAAPLHG